MALANFSMLFNKTNVEGPVAICLCCNVTVINMARNTDAMLVHTILQPQCAFIQRQLSLEAIYNIICTNDCNDIYSRHFYR